MASSYSNSIQHTQEQAQLFLDTFFAPYLKEQGGYIALCSSAGKRAWKQEFHTDTYLATQRSADLYLEDCDTYFCVNPVKSTSRKISAVRDILRLHVDADFKDASGIKRLLSLKPTAVIASGTKHRYHGYWNFHTPLSREVHARDIERMNRQLTRILGIKEEAFDLSRALRVPGTANFKDRRNPRPVEIEEWRPELNFTLEQCADLLEIKLDDHPYSQKLLIISSEDRIEGERGKYLSREGRSYVERLLHEGLFESESRNKAMLLLIRYYYERELSQETAQQKITEFFEQHNNGLSNEWRDSPKLVIEKINCAVKNWFKKARPVQASLEGSQLKRLNRKDEAFIQNQELKERDKLFLRDAMTWILNNKRGDSLILSTRQLMKFTNCNNKNYQLKREILYRLGIIALAVEHNPKDKLANEYKVLHQFEAPLATRRGRRRLSEIDVGIEVDRMLLSGVSNKTIRERFPTVTRQRIQSRRKTFDYTAAQSRAFLEI